MSNTNLIEFYAFLKEHGIVWTETLAGHLTYGPLGKKIKNNVEKYIKDCFNTYYDEIETPLIYSKDDWIRSGHWDKFSDPIVNTKDNKKYRLDHLIKKKFDIEFETLTHEHILSLIQKLGCQFIPEIHYKDLMMKVISGNQECALRPETATATFLCYKNLMTYYKKLPIYVYQIGKAFRNEINPKNSLIRTREFIQAEAQIFISQKDKLIHPDYDFIKNFKVNTSYGIFTLHELNLSSQYYTWLLYFAYNIFIKIFDISYIRLRRHNDNEKAFYALDAWDIEINLNNIGWTEICGIHDRGNYDLKQHNLHNNTHILELAIGLDRLVYALLDTSYNKKLVNNGKSTLLLPYQFAPYKVAVLPLLKNNKDIIEKSEYIYKLFKNKAIYKKNKSIGKRYLECNLLGIPYCITIDFRTLDDNTVTIRDRNIDDPNLNQIRVNINDLTKYI
jgi:glycyl-tRNA synthetase